MSLQKEERKYRRRWVPQSICAILLLWALCPENPYGYYVFLRLVVCAVFAYLAIKSICLERPSWLSGMLGITTIVYNPIFSFHFSREVWSIVNILTIGIAAVSIVAMPDFPASVENFFRRAKIRLRLWSGVKSAAWAIIFTFIPLMILLVGFVRVDDTQKEAERFQMVLILTTLLSVIGFIGGVLKKQESNSQS